MKKIYIILLLTSSLFAQNLKELIDFALKNSVIIKQVKTQLKISDLSHKEAKKNRFGVINAVGSYTHYNKERTLAPISPIDMMSKTPITVTKDIYSVGVNYTVPLFTGYGITRAIEISKLAKEMTKAKYFLAKEELVYNIKALYLSILSLQELKKAQQKYINALNRLKDDIALKVKLGKKANIDLLKTKADIQEAIANLENIDSNIEIAKSSLAILVGKNIKNLEPINFRVTKKYYSKDALFKKALKLHKIQVEDLMIKKADKYVQKTKSALYPQLSLNAYYGKNYGEDIKTNNDDSEELYQVGLNAKYTLVDFGKTNISIQKAKVQKLQAKLQKSKTILELKKQITQAISKIKTSYAVFKSSQKRYALSKKAANIEKTKYDADASTLNDLLLAKAKENLAFAKLIQSKYDYKKSLYYLDYIMERGVKSER